MYPNLRKSIQSASSAFNESFCNRTQMTQIVMISADKCKGKSEGCTVMLLIYNGVTDGNLRFEAESGGRERKDEGRRMKKGTFSMSAFVFVSGDSSSG